MPRPQILHDAYIEELLLATDSRTLPDLPNKKSKTNWVEEAGGLPSYINRIAKHLHSEKGMTVSRAIATAVNTVKRWAAGGDNVSAKTKALAAKAVAEWESKKASTKVNASIQPGRVRFEGFRLAQDDVDAIQQAAMQMDLASDNEFDEGAFRLAQVVERRRRSSLNLAILFDPKAHPRDYRGRFADVLDTMAVGQTVKLPAGVTVTKSMDAPHGLTGRSDKRYVVERNGKELADTHDERIAAEVAADTSVNRDPEVMLNDDGVIVPDPYGPNWHPEQMDDYEIPEGFGTADWMDEPTPDDVMEGVRGAPLPSAVPEEATGLIVRNVATPSTDIQAKGLRNALEEILDDFGPSNVAVVASDREGDPPDTLLVSATSHGFENIQHGTWVVYPGGLHERDH